MLITCWSHVGHFGISIWNLEALRKQSGSSQDGFWSVFSVQEQPQEVAEVLPAAAKKASKVQLRLCSCRASRIFASFLQSATIRPIYSAFMWFVKQAWLQFFQNFDRCRRSPVWRWKHLQLQRHALVCDMMHHCATDLTEPCRPDDQCDNAIDGHLYVMDLFCQLGIVRNYQSQCWSHVEHFGMFFGNMKNWKTKPFWEISAKIIAECWVLSSEPRSL